METNGINEKMFEFQKRVQAIKKDAKNPHFKNTYASLNQILSEVKPLLTEVGLVLTPLPCLRNWPAQLLTHSAYLLAP